MKSQPFLVPVCGMIIGILFSESFRNDGFIQFRWIILPLMLIVLFILFRQKAKSPTMILMIFTAYGFFASGLYNRWQPLPEEWIEREMTVQLRIIETFRSSENFRKYKAVLNSVEQHRTAETGVLLYWDRKLPELYAGNEIQIQTRITELQPVLNPYQFDYSAYLNRNGIHYMVFHKGEFVALNQPKGFRHSVSVFKRKIHNRMLNLGYGKQTADIIGAMLLGDRTEMDSEIEEDYRKTGVVHLLSISGLHVVMVYSIFMLLLYPMLYLRNGKNIRILTSLLLIWIFVAFVEFKPPVFRSGLMISIYYITVLMRRKPNIYHTLLLSAMILLLYNPNFIFDAGFLLSFSAVFFIVYFHPVYQKIFRPRNRFYRQIIGFTGTSISAQLGTLPFSVFFFNQTSGLFLAGNVVMISASYIMIAGGMLTVFLVTMNIDFVYWQKLFDLFIESCNSYVRWLAKFDVLVFERLSLSIAEMLLVLIAFLMLRQLYFQPKAKFVYVFLTLVLIFEVQGVLRLSQLAQKEEIIVFHQRRNTVIGVRKGFQMDLFLAEPEDSSVVEKYTVRPYMIHQKIKSVRFLDLNVSAKGFYEKLPHYIELNDKRLVLYSSGSDSVIRPKDFVLIRNNESIEILPEEVLIITDGSNYPNHFEHSEYVKHWNTHKQGALIIK